MATSWRGKLSGGDIGRVRDKKTTSSGDSYKVLLIDDARHTEKLVVKALPRAVPTVTLDDASKLFHVSGENGLVVVLVTVKACFLLPNPEGRVKCIGVASWPFVTVLKKT
ncbi:ATP-dependent Clp protease adapter protein ClpS1, chloroplastic-like protein [Tanacetum coccineum]